MSVTRWTEEDDRECSLCPGDRSVSKDMGWEGKLEIMECWIPIMQVVADAMALLDGQNNFSSLYQRPAMQGWHR